MEDRTTREAAEALRHRTRTARASPARTVWAVTVSILVATAAVTLGVGLWPL